MLLAALSYVIASSPAALSSLITCGDLISRSSFFSHLLRWSLFSPASILSLAAFSSLTACVDHISAALSFDAHLWLSPLSLSVALFSLIACGPLISCSPRLQLPPLGLLRCLPAGLFRRSHGLFRYFLVHFQRGNDDEGMYIDLFVTTWDISGAVYTRRNNRSQHSDHMDHNEVKLWQEEYVINTNTGSKYWFIQEFTFSYTMSYTILNKHHHGIYNLSHVLYAVTTFIQALKLT